MKNENTKEIVVGSFTDSTRLTDSERRERAWETFKKVEWAEEKPSKGKLVLIDGGRKHTGKVGIVFWHGRDKFAGSSYGDSFQRAAADAMGRHGFRVGVEDAETGERFFVPAEYASVRPKESYFGKGEN